MCKSLVHKGHLNNPLIVFNRTQKKAVELEALLPRGSLVVADSIKDAVMRSDIIFTLGR